MADQWSTTDSESGATGWPQPSDGGYGIVGSPPSRPTAAVRPAWPATVEKLGPAEPWSPPNDDAHRRAPPDTPDPGTDRAAQQGQAQVTGRTPARDAPPGAAAPRRGQSVPVDAVPCEGAQIVGRVGPHVILASDVWIAGDAVLAQNREKIRPDQVESQREILIKHSFRPLLKKLVDTKLVYYDAVNALPKEAIENVEDQVSRVFERSELLNMMELWNVDSQRELDQKLMSLGTSVQRHKRAFTEQMIAQQWIREKIKIDEDVNHEQMLTYYDQHVSEFEQPARARWEQLTVRIARYPSKEAARAALARMGNQVIDGRPLTEVGREQSDGPTAAQGGVRPWTNQGSLVSEVLDRAIFGLPVGRLSPILEDKGSLHIVRVTQREDARRAPFRDAQVEIRKKIRQQRNMLQQQAYLDRLRRRVPVWTLYGEQQEASGFLNPRR